MFNTAEKDAEGREFHSEKGTAQEEFEKRTTSIVDVVDGLEVNASGHPDELKRQYSVWSICGLALTIDSAWIALGGSIAVAVANGGPPGILYEFLVACFWYALLGACIAELASAIPTAGGVYHWASLTPGPRWGRIVGFFAGSLNFFGWIFDLASIVQIVANICVQLYVVYHPDFIVHPWHTYVTYVMLTWGCAIFCIFFNRYIPALQDVGLFLIIVGGIVTIIVVTAMPKQHASHSFVWTDFQNATGWGNGVAFLTGVLNGAFTIGTPDSCTKCAEELPNPRKDLPKAIFAQIGLGTITSFLFAIAIMYGINNLSGVISANGSFPLAEVYLQATGSPGATFGLLFIIMLDLLICLVGTLLTLSRSWWSLARDDATPFPKLFSKVNHKLSCPVPAMIFVAVLCTGLGAIGLGSKAAFSDLVGSFIILSTTSYILAIAPHLLSGRKHVPPGWFWMGKLGFPVQALAVLLTIFFDIMFCFPYAFPTTATLMNYNSVILVGVIALTAVWWFIHGRAKYPGPKLAQLYIDGVEPKSN